MCIKSNQILCIRIHVSSVNIIYAFSIIHLKSHSKSHIKYSASPTHHTKKSVTLKMQIHYCILFDERRQYLNIISLYRHHSSLSLSLSHSQVFFIRDFDVRYISSHQVVTWAKVKKKSFVTLPKSLYISGI